MRKTLLPIFLYTMLLLNCVFTLAAQGFDYGSSWKEIEVLQQERLPKSASAKLDTLYQIAQTENRVDQQLKALIWEFSVIDPHRGATEARPIQRSLERLDGAGVPASAIIHSVLGAQYWAYLQRNLERLEKSGSAFYADEGDINTWDKHALVQRAAEHFLHSLEQAEQLGNVSLADYQAILVGSQHAFTHYPSLFDFLANRALSFLTHADVMSVLGYDEATLEGEIYFAEAASFGIMQTSSTEIDFYLAQILAIYQKLINLHIHDEDPVALVEADLSRLSFVFDRSSHERAEQLYETALLRDREQYSQHPVYANYCHIMAEHYKSLVVRYQPGLRDKYKMYYLLALDLCREGMTAFPESLGGEACKDLARLIEARDITIMAEEWLSPNTPFKVRLGTRNINSVKLQLYRLDKLPDSWEEVSFGREISSSAQFSYIRNQELIMDSNFEWVDEGDMRGSSRELPIIGVSAGYYVVIASAIKEDGQATYPQAAVLLKVHSVSIVWRNRIYPSFMVLNRETGQPIEGVALIQQTGRRNAQEERLYYTNERTYFSNKDGVISGIMQDLYISNRDVIVCEGDTLNFGRLRFPRWHAPRMSYRGELYTDRAIYRPGQTVHIKGIIFHGDGHKRHEMLVPWDITLLVFNPQNTVIARHIVTNNLNGSFNLSFTAPEGQTGIYRISVCDLNTEIHIEEYKRPQFEVLLEMPSEAYALWQNVAIQGQAFAYAGYPIDNAKYKYRVERSLSYSPAAVKPKNLQVSGPKDIAFGKGETDADGRFTIEFQALPDRNINPDSQAFYSYQIYVDVLSLAGETQSANLEIRAGYQDILLSLELAEDIDLRDKKLDIPFQITNLMGNPVSVPSEISISQLNTPKRIQRARLWTKPSKTYLGETEYHELFPDDVYMDEDDHSTWETKQLTYSQAFAASEGQNIHLEDLLDWVPGAYRIEIRTDSAVFERYFRVFDSESNELPLPLPFWVFPKQVLCEPGEMAEIMVGSSYPEARIYCEIEKDYAISDSLWLNPDRGFVKLELPVLESDRGGFFVHLHMVMRGRLYTHRQQISVPFSNKELKIQLSTFRDKLMPGNQESWSLKVLNYLGDPVEAEVLVSMYDASLDSFIRRDWGSQLHGTYTAYYGWINDRFSVLRTRSAQSRLYHNNKFQKMRVPALNWLGYYQEYYDLKHYRRNPNTVYCMMESVSGDQVAQMLDPANNSSRVEQGSASVIRKNFAETAFWYPDLRAKDGTELEFSFTVPESLTRWKFRALALASELQTGYIEQYAISQKPLMVQANAPRFIREGDQMRFSASVIALDGKSHKGRCTLQFFDAISLKEVDLMVKKGSSTQSFQLSEGGSIALSWQIRIPENLKAINYRIIAETRSFSDGEQKLLPVLPKRVFVTQSMPMKVNGRSTRSFNFDDFYASIGSKTITNHSLSLEFSSNPMWYALQSLPYMMDYYAEDNAQIFSRLYANLIGTHIVNSNAQTREIISSWLSAEDGRALVSNLEKNPELKSLILEESPWLFTAANETESKQQIARLLDLESMRKRANNDFMRLQQNQLPNGSWPWCPGHNGSRWTTQYIVQGYGHLRKLGIKSIDDVYRDGQLLRKACLYLDNQILLQYQEVLEKENQDFNNLDHYAVHYLYTRSFFKNLPVHNNSQIAYDYFSAQADVYWINMDLYSQAMIALTKHRHGNYQIAAKIIESISERATQDEELGIYWEELIPGNFWYQSQIQTMAILAELYSEVANDLQMVDGIRTWLIRNKQSTHWRSGIATAEACYAMLLSGSALQSSWQMADIIWGNEPVQVSNTKLRTDYFKQTITKAKITREKARVKIKNHNPDLAWGALYWQYFEDIDKFIAAVPA